MLFILQSCRIKDFLNPDKVKRTCLFLRQLRENPSQAKGSKGVESQISQRMPGTGLLTSQGMGMWAFDLYRSVLSAGHECSTRNENVYLVNCEYSIVTSSRIYEVWSESENENMR
jgi:hypothetical protein